MAGTSIGLVSQRTCDGLGIQVDHVKRQVGLEADLQIGQYLHAEGTHLRKWDMTLSSGKRESSSAQRGLPDRAFWRGTVASVAVFCELVTDWW